MQSLEEGANLEQRYTQVNMIVNVLIAVIKIKIQGWPIFYAYSNWSLFRFVRKSLSKKNPLT